MAFFSPLVCIFSFSLLSPVFFPFIYSSPTAFTIPLSHFHQDPLPLPDPYLHLSYLASTSMTRAHHIRNPQNAPVSTTPLSPHSYGAYSISLGFGTPPQTIPFIMDTGSDFVWFPCTHRYLCRNCTTSPGEPPIIPSFIPKQSYSSRVLGCLNPKCGVVHSNFNVHTGCQDCEPNSKNCTQICPPYLIVYGSGSTGGIALVEVLDLPGKKVGGFVVGCSLFSSHQPAGIAGFGRGPSSLPSQLGLKRFSYCLVSHKFDDKKESSLMVLDSGDKNAAGKSLSYTPFLKNPVLAGRHAFSVYYYVGLRKITVGGRKVKIPFKYLSPGNDGNGGTIVDSGTTLTYMTKNVFEILVTAFTEQVKDYKREEKVEMEIGLWPCFNVSGLKSLKLPEMRFYFKGGAEMALPLENYFSVAGEMEVVCLTMVTDRESSGGELAGGPAIILGNFQLQNFETEFDLEKERFGFQQKKCK